MKKGRLIIACVIIMTILVSCANKSNDVSIYDDNEIAFEGKYISNDESTVIITQIDEKFDIAIDIVRLTGIDDGVGKPLSKDKIEFYATDAQENPISGEIFWKNQDAIKVEFTNSTWRYLPNGTVFNFSRVDSQTP